MNELYLVRFQPDMRAFALWALRRGLLHKDVDEGYAWHAVLKAALGDIAPKPFVVRERERRIELLGYCPQDPAQFPVLTQDPEAVQVVGLDRNIQSRAMPSSWQQGQLLSFEVRVRPVVRVKPTREAPSREVDVALRARARDATMTRDAAYEAWLNTELARGGAAELCQYRPMRFRRCKVLRPTQARDNGKGRERHAVEGPDLTVRGELRINNPEAFSALLARGIGRHRAFGFGCLLLAPPGVLR